MKKFLFIFFIVPSVIFSSDKGLGKDKASVHSETSSDLDPRVLMQAHLSFLGVHAASWEEYLAKLAPGGQAFKEDASKRFEKK